MALVVTPLLKDGTTGEDMTLQSNDFEPTINQPNKDDVIEIIIRRKDGKPLEPSDLPVLKVIACGRFVKVFAHLLYFYLI